MKLQTTALVAAMTMGVALTAVAQDLGEPDAAINYRQDAMGAVGGHIRAMVAILNGEVDNSGGLAAHAAALEASTDPDILMAAFMQNTHGLGSEETTATALIWEDWDGFAEQLTLLNTAAAGISELAAAGDLNDFEQLRPALSTCGACHRELGYRER